jgi:hypothetical protein
MGCDEYVKLVKDFVEGAGLERRPSDVKGKEPRGAKIQL